MERLFRDIRFGFRSLLKRPAFAAIAVGTLALGIGANTTIFSVVNAVLLRPLPYPSSDQLVVIWGKLPTHGLNKLSVSPAEFVDYRNRNHTFSAIATYSSIGRNLTGAGEPERLNVTFVTEDFFSVLATRPQTGRTFLHDEDQPGHNHVAILSHSLWQRHFAGDQSIVGRSVMLDGVSHEIIGVMPAGFQFPDSETQIWKPMAFDADDLSENNRGSHYLDLIARMKPGVTLAQAQADVGSIAAQMQREHLDHYEEGSGWGASVVGLHKEIVGDVRPALLVLFAVVGFVLLIACANVANLLLARAAAREREIAIRTALGAGRLQILQQLLVESLLLSLAGGAIGILIAVWGKDLLTALNPASLPRINEIHVDGRVIAFTFAVSLFTGLVFGIIPALQASKLNLSESLKEGSGKTTEGRSRLRLRGLLVISEVAMAMVLLIGAGLMIKSLYRLQQVDLGFNPNNILTLRLALPQAKYQKPQLQRAFFDELIGKVEGLPGVKSLGLVNFLPLSGSGNRRNISVEGKPENPINVEFRLSNPQYFSAMGIELSKGRYFDEHDRENTTYVTVVNEAFTRTFLPGEDPLGKRIKMGGLNSPFRWLSVVGVIKDIKHQGLDVDARPEMYIPYLQPPLPDWNVQSMFLAVRTDHEPQSLIGAMRGAVHEIDAEQPIYGVATMQQSLTESVAPRRFNMLLIAAFSALALLLASIGIYGVVSYSVTQRIREFGIRMALGARTFDVLKLVIKSGMALTFIGIAIGLGTALALTRLMTTLLFGVAPTDAATFAAVSILLVLVALLACYLPARRAAKVDPLVALRYE
ncbi:MAG: ABC transporter permease [Pyrinomonadaceae bacterium]